jgi:hypothetical protein
MRFRRAYLYALDVNEAFNTRSILFMPYTGANNALPLLTIQPPYLLHHRYQLFIITFRTCNPFATLAFESRLKFC